MLVVDDDDDDMFMCLCIQLFVYISSQNNMILMRSHRRPYSAETMTLKSFIASGKLVKNSTSNTISSDLICLHLSIKKISNLVQSYR